MLDHISCADLARYNKYESITELQFDSIHSHLKHCDFCQQRRKQLAKGHKLPGMPGSELPDEIHGFLILRKMHGGRDSTVYQGWRESSGRWYALKVFNAKNVPREEVLDEVRVVAKITDCPTAVNFIDVKHGPDCIIQEYIADGSLENALRDALDGAKPWLPWKTVVDRMIDVAEAVSFLHRNAITHCDIKPANILVRTTEKAVLADFGSAVDRNGPSLSRKSNSYTLEYLSPEGLKDLEFASLPESDIYSLGVTMYELLTGQLPFRGDSKSEILQQIEKGVVPSPTSIQPDVPTELDELCLRMISSTYVLGTLRPVF